MFWAPCGSAGGGAGWMGVGGGWGVSPTHVHMHAHTHACMCMRGKHDNSMQMAAPIGFGEIPGIPYDVIHACACMCVRAYACMHMRVHMCGGTLSPPPTSTHPPPPRGGPWNQSKFNSTWTNRDISILFEDLKSVENSPPMGGCIISWVGGWVDGWGQVKSLKI